MLDQTREKETPAYNVGQKLCLYLASYDRPINSDRFADKLVGALCELTFTLRHYVIGGQMTLDVKEVGANNVSVFSAQVETVVILEYPLVVVCSPYKGRLTMQLHPICLRLPGLLPIVPDSNCLLQPHQHQFSLWFWMVAREKDKAQVPSLKEHKLTCVIFGFII